MTMIELIVPEADAEALKKQLAQNPAMRVEGPVRSRDLATAVAVITIAAETIAIVNGLLDLQKELKRRKSTTTVEVRRTDGTRQQLQSATKESLEQFVHEEQ